MAGVVLQPWNIDLSRIGPPTLPPLSALQRPPVAPTREPHPRWPYTNIVFEGGGAKGIAYMGAIEVLEQEGIYPKHVLRVAGASSGSFLAAMLAIGMSSQELTQMLAETDLEAVMRDARFGMVSGLWNMVTIYGLNPGSRLLEFLGERLKERTGSEDVTFAQVLERCGRELLVPVTNLTRMCTEYCHPKTTPDMPVRLAVGMSMSLPVLMVPYRVVRGGEQTGGQADLYTDGGLLCNFPVHAFDGWWLSMDRQDTFLRKLRPLDRVTELTHDAVRFSPRNPATLGFTVFDKAELGDASEWWMTADMRPPERPDTELARSRAQSEKRLEAHTRLREALDGAAQRLVDALAELEEDGDGRVDRKEVQGLFEGGRLTPQDAQLLFETQDVDAIFSAMDHNGDGKVSYDEIVRTIDSRHVDLTAHLGLARSEPRSMSTFVSTVFNTLLMHLRRVSLVPDDRTRTVPIDTDYVSTTDFELDARDREFLLETGRRSTRAFFAGRREET
ncbi:MAG: patatin-like phospholipase family protein [Myxococcales bacterium]|nr:patatin-like phospholipase family protein [Myxococcales bacterium]